MANVIDAVSYITFVNDPVCIKALKNELSSYMARAEELAAELVLLVQLSSASCQRVVLILVTSFGDLQDMALRDYIEFP